LLLLENKNQNWNHSQNDILICWHFGSTSTKVHFGQC